MRRMTLKILQDKVDWLNKTYPVEGETYEIGTEYDGYCLRLRSATSGITINIFGFLPKKTLMKYIVAYIEGIRMGRLMTTRLLTNRH